MSKPQLRAIAINLSLVVGSLVVCLLVFELVVFRFIWLASDVPRIDFVNDVVRYAPNQQGVWRFRNEIAAPYRINAQGWNSGFGDYVHERRAGVLRIAVVGDSYVDAEHVAYTESLAEVLQRALIKDGRPTEVYRFGINGAPLSQYVHMIEREVVGYRPDWIVVNVVHNDFDQSFQFVQGRYTSTFMKFRVEDGKVTGEIPPTPWHPGILETVRLTATARFLRYRWQVRPAFLVDFFIPPPAATDASTPPAEEQWAANVEINSILAVRREVEAAADHAVVRIAALAKGIGAHALLVMDGDRPAIYDGQVESRALVLNRILADAAERHGIPHIDLHAVFKAHWAAHHQSFNFVREAHWNELAHRIVGTTIAEHIRNAR